jgi:hypothetical protein
MLDAVLYESERRLCVEAGTLRVGGHAGAVMAWIVGRDGGGGSGATTGSGSKGSVGPVCGGAGGSVGRRVHFGPDVVMGAGDGGDGAGSGSGGGAGEFGSVLIGDAADVVDDEDSIPLVRTIVLYCACAVPPLHSTVRNPVLYCSGLRCTVPHTATHGLAVP